MADTIRKLTHTAAEVDDNIDEVVVARGTFDSLDERLDATEVPEVGVNDDGKILKASYTGGVGTYSWQTGGGGGGGTSDYSDLDNKPQINSITLSGNKTSSDLGLQSEIDSSHKLSADLIDDTSATNKFVTATEKNTWNGKQDALTFDNEPTASSNNPVKSGGVYTALIGKVDVESGKGLSANDFTDTLKSKLDGIASGAEVNVQSDWNQTNNAADDFIKNKPTLGTAAAAATTDFATAAQGTKADSAIQSAGTGLSKSGTTINHSNSVTAKTSSSVKKFTYDANGHVTGSSELSTAESNALASGIDSTKVEQIETNKNNISINANYGVKNRAAPATVVSPSPDITVVQDSEGHYEISGDSGGVQRTIRIYDPSTPLECTEEMFVAPANTSENTTYACYWTLNDNDNFTTIPAQGLTIPIGAKINRLYIQVQANKIFDFVVNLMVCPKSLYDADPSHQPFAMSNAELTAAIQALQAQLANQ